MRFELQVRTVLQHAWAEIEHDRSYKFAGVLPRPLQRRLYLLAGVLELADREFASLATEIDDYAAEVTRKTQAGNLDIEINTTSLLQYLSPKVEYLINAGLTDLDQTLSDEVVAELLDFNLKTLSDLDTLITTEALTTIVKHQPDFTLTGFLRCIMMMTALERYFRDCWNDHWEVIGPDTFAMLIEKYGSNIVDDVLRRYQIHTEDDF